MRMILWIAALSGIFLAFFWPLAVGEDPSSIAFHVAAIATLVAFLGSIAALLATKR
ncbi:MAG TPA: hypothetical protein VM051_12310 [Usitatibacter sp.]|nr:hypothetical protein [Usitatibacter sp.]